MLRVKSVTKFLTLKMFLMAALTLSTKEMLYMLFLGMVLAFLIVLLPSYSRMKYLDQIYVRQ